MALGIVFLLAALSVWLYAAVRDVRTRQVSNYVFVSLGALGVVRALTVDVNLLALALSVSVLCPLAVLLWSRCDVGGADAKALMVSGVLYPESIAVFLVWTGLGFVASAKVWSEDVPAFVGFAGGATVATGMIYL